MKSHEDSKECPTKSETAFLFRESKKLPTPMKRKFTEE
jgi:hypothetical protein